MVTDLAFLTMQKKKASQAWRDRKRRVGRSAAGDRIFSERRESHTLRAVRSEYYLSYQDFAQFSEKLIIEIIEMTVLFSSVAVSGGNSVNQFGD